MTKRNQIYKCELCGNITQVLHEGVGELVCCNQPMNLLIAGSFDAALEKHVPQFQKTDQSIKVKVGEIDHPMENNHFIEWIEVITSKNNFRKFLQPNEIPKAEFSLDKEEVLEINTFCNLHGLWKST